MPTLQDVASLAGVSTATVSKVLSNTPYVSEATRDRVLQAIAELGYTPNLAARALSSGRTHIIAVVFPYVYDAIFKDPHVMAILEGIEASLTSADYNILLSTPRLSPNGPDESFRLLLRSGYIEGMIAIDNVPIASVAAEAQAAGVPTVVIGYHEAAASVRGDDEAGGRLLAAHLIDLGHRQLGVIGVPDTTNYAVDARRRGIRMALAEANLPVQSLAFYAGDFSTRSGAEAVTALLTKHPDLTAIIAMNDRMAMGAIQALQQMGRCVPDDISVTGYDNLAISELVTPPLTTIDPLANQLGQTAVRLLVDSLQNNAYSHEVLPPELVVRASTAAPIPVSR